MQVSLLAACRGYDEAQFSIPKYGLPQYILVSSLTLLFGG